MSTKPKSRKSAPAERFFRITNPGSHWSALIGATEVGLAALRALGGGGDELLKARCGYDLVAVGLHRCARPLLRASLITRSTSQVIEIARASHSWLPAFDGRTGLRIVECGGFDFGSFAVEEEVAS